jgi:hypothetical protein
MFIKHYKFEECNVNFLTYTSTFVGSYQEARGGTLWPKQKMEVFLRYVGDPGFQVGEDKVSIDLRSPELLIVSPLFSYFSLLSNWFSSSTKFSGY